MFRSKLVAEVKMCEQQLQSKVVGWTQAVAGLEQSKAGAGFGYAAAQESLRPFIARRTQPSYLNSNLRRFQTLSSFLLPQPHALSGKVKKRKKDGKVYFHIQLPTLGFRFVWNFLSSVSQVINAIMIIIIVIAVVIIILIIILITFHSNLSTEKRFEELRLVCLPASLPNPPPQNVGFTLQLAKSYESSQHIYVHKKKLCASQICKIIWKFTTHICA